MKINFSIKNEKKIIRFALCMQQELQIFTEFSNGEKKIT